MTGYPVRPRRFVLLSLLLLCFSTSLFAQNGGAPEIVWTFETGGPIWGSSTTRDGVLYVASTDSAVYALRAGTGALLWRFETGGPIYGDVAVYDGYLYAGSDDGFLYKLNRADGSEHWRFNIHEATPLERFEPGNFVNTNRGFDFRGPNPIEADGIVYVGSPDTRLYAIDATTGTKKWFFETDDIVRSQPAVADGKVIFGSYDGRVYALDKETGDQRWVVDTGAPVTAAPLVHDGVVYLGNRSTRTTTGMLYALDVAAGETIWTKEWGEGSWVESSAVFYDGTVYIGSSFWATTLAIDPATGASVWERRVGGGAYSTPALTQDAGYTGTVGFDNDRGLTGALLRLDRATGEEVWRFPFPKIPGRFYHGVSASPEVVDGLILFGAHDGVFYALRE